MTKVARSPTRTVTARQQQVVALVARGLTTKEIAHQLQISERGVSAHISRLLAKFNVSNRAGLVAHTFSQLVSGAVTVGAPADLTDPRVLPVDEIARELAGFQSSKFLVTLTLGPDPVFVFMNDAAARAMGLDAKSIVGVRVRDRFGDPSIASWLEKSEEAFRTGVPVSLENAASRWLRDDGTWTTEIFNCVLQPVRDASGSVNGMLWICVVTSSSSSSPARDLEPRVF
ncbi:MAG: PAS domain-containing protein [Chloroflexi bacterium]|nr:MAG: PAS domain-containing protein [Chloroflexota bacterium]